MGDTKINYKSLDDGSKISSEGNDLEMSYEIDDTPRNSGIMIHTVPEVNKARWNHIQDLDSFFTKMYHYHQKHGFLVIVLDEIFQLFKFAFVIWLLTFTIHCLNYYMMFGKHAHGNFTRVSINDVVFPMDVCVSNFGPLTYCILIISMLYMFIRSIKLFYNVTQYWDIKKFYNTALGIDDSELDNVTWHEIKKKVRDVQTEQHMCIDKDHLTDLDIYHRILRFKNYMVALMNKNLLPVRFTIPIFGEVVAVSRGLLFNVDLILFRSPGSPFQNSWQLRDDYTIRGNQVELANRLSKLIIWIALANLLLAPLIFVWQIVYFSFTYANILKKEPGALGMRTWSNYGRLYLRHFNELDHELDARLNRAYEYADRYLSSFSCPLTTVIAKNILFISGGLLLILLLLGIYDEHVFQVEHVLTVITALSVIGLICRNFIPDDNLIWCPEQLMTAILAHVHYLPSTWKNKAHTSAVQKEFSIFFQFKANYFLNEIFSPLITPFLLLFVFRPKALEIVKFFRSFTVSVRGVGNVCSFAQMDVRKHGNPEWQIENICQSNKNTNGESEDKLKSSPLQNGKTELSLIRFTLMNPEWQMPSVAMSFVSDVRRHALIDFTKANNEGVFNENPLTESLVSFGTIKDEYSSFTRSLFDRHNIKRDNEQLLESLQNRKEPHIPNQFEQMLQQNLGEQSHCTSEYRSAKLKTVNNSFGKNELKRLRVSKVEGCLEGPSHSLLCSLNGELPIWEHRPSDLTIADMCFNTLYLHEIHNRKKSEQSDKSNLKVDSSHTSQSNSAAKVVETTPLLGMHV